MFISKVTPLVCALFALIPITSFSSEAKDIAYLRLTDGYWQIWLTDMAGREHNQLTHGKYDYTRLHWPLDHQFLIASRSDGKVLKVNPKSGEQQAISLPFTEVLDASVSPDGKWLAFSYAEKKGAKAKINIWRTKIDGSEPKQLTYLDEAQVIPVWSSAGNNLAFTYLGIKKGKQYEIWEIDLATNSRQQHTAGAGFNFDPAYGPNGELAYTSNLAGQYDIWVLQPDMKRIKLTDDPATQEQASWSPDGQYISYVSFNSDQQRIWVSDKQGNNARAITPEAAFSRGPAWFN